MIRKAWRSTARSITLAGWVSSPSTKMEYRFNKQLTKRKSWSSSVSMLRSVSGEKLKETGMSGYIFFAMTSQARARRSWRSESQSSSMAWILNHRRHTSKPNRMQPRRSSPPAALAVWTTALVMILLLGSVMILSSSSQEMTCSIWYFRRRATLVTSLAG